MYAKVYNYKFQGLSEAKVAATFCSENLGKNMMNYDPSWKRIENNFDKNNNTNSKVLTKHTWGVTLKDILIFENWIIYAKTIGDESYKKLNI